MEEFRMRDIYKPDETGDDVKIPEEVSIYSNTS
jgi:hypothetical protein